MFTAILTTSTYIWRTNIEKNIINLVKSGKAHEGKILKCLKFDKKVVPGEKTQTLLPPGPKIYKIQRNFEYYEPPVHTHIMLGSNKNYIAPSIPIQIGGGYITNKYKTIVVSNNFLDKLPSHNIKYDVPWEEMIIKNKDKKQILTELDEIDILEDIPGKIKLKLYSCPDSIYYLHNTNVDKLCISDSKDKLIEKYILDDTSVIGIPGLVGLLGIWIDCRIYDMFF